MTDHAALDRHIARVRALPGLVERAAPSAAAAVDAAMRASITAGAAPDGKAWEATQTGKRPLANAAAALSVSAVGTAIVATVTGPEALHDRGWVRGGKRRQLLPEKITAPIATAIDGALSAEFARTMGER